MLTDDALRMVGEQLAQSAAELRVLDGGQAAAAAVGARDVSVDGGTVTVTLTATFGADDANMEWARRQVVAGDGQVLDDTTEDHGRKAQGAVWTLEATIEIGGDG